MLYTLKQNYLMIKKLLPILLFLISLFSFGQNPDTKRSNHWFFGKGAGIDFSNGNAVADTAGRLYSREECSSISDSLGYLQFYTDGDTVWNKNHQPMPNGYGLKGCGSWDNSSTQTIIVPKPNNSTLFYVFTNDCGENSGAQGFRYSIVDLTADLGLGDIISKNNLLYAPSTEAVVATKHGNGHDFWIVTHEYNSNSFHSYLLTSSGLDTLPVLSQTGAIYSYYVTMLAFSPNNKMLAATPTLAIGDQIFLFNDTTGIISNPITIPAYSGEYSPRFSPDNSKLYLQQGNSIIMQYCVSTYDSLSINQSRFEMHYYSGSFGSIQTGPDNKFYISSIYNDTISTIDYPNNYGTSCGLHFHNIALGGRLSYLGLPNFVETFFNNDTIPSFCDSVITQINEYDSKQEFNVFPNPSNGVYYISLNTQIIETIKVTDVMGKLIYEYKNISNRVYSFDITNQTRGIYIVYILTKTNVYTIKLIKT